jgi:SET domain-containing protein
MSGTIVTKPPLSGSHSMFLGNVGSCNLTLDSVGTTASLMHLVNHACEPFCNCNAVQVVCPTTGLTLWCLKTLRDIDANEQVTYAYGGLFWKHIETIVPREKSGYRLVCCSCDPETGKCHNNFARHERVRR